MVQNKENSPVRGGPTKFVSLHNHSGASTYDGLGPVETHFDFCIDNGLDAHAITEHGHMNSYAAAQLYYEKLKDKGIPFKYIPGVEAYVHPDLDAWRRDKQDRDERKEEIRQAKKDAKKRGEDPASIEDIDGNNQLTVENEEASKQKKFDPVNRRHHMVVLPKTAAALQKIYGLVSYGYLDGFYRFPRMDAKAIRSAANGDGDIILSTACIGGPFAYEIFGSFESASWDELTPAQLTPENWKEVLRRVGNVHDLWADTVGVENLFLELQFNKLPQQDLVNLVLLKYADENGLLEQLIVTCDAHYPGPDKWIQREMYKKLGYMNYQEINPDSLPKSVDELKAELYPKNAQQIWDEYLRSRTRLTDEYAPYDDVVCDAMERTHDLAHQVIMEISPNRKPKFPESVVEEGNTPMRQLVELCKTGLIERGHADKPEYIAQIKNELAVMKELEVPLYFITLSRIMKLAREKVLIGPCRGCFVPETGVVMSNKTKKNIDQVVVGDFIRDAYGNERVVEDTFVYDVDEDVVELQFEDRTVTCTLDHLFLTSNRGWVKAIDLIDTDDVVNIS